MRGSEEVTEFPDPEPYEIEGVQHYRPGKDPSERYLPSKLEDAEKRPHNVPFTPSAQTAKNVGITVKCAECERPRLLYSKQKLKDRQLKVLKIFISKIIYICGSTLLEYDGTENREEEKISESVFSQENLSCQSKIELPYYSIDFLKPVCIYCGKEGTKRTIEVNQVVYPKCKECEKENDIPHRKRKLVTSDDLQKKSKR